MRTHDEGATKMGETRKRTDAERREAAGKFVAQMADMVGKLTAHVRHLGLEADAAERQVKALSRKIDEMKDGLPDADL